MGEEQNHINITIGDEPVVLKESLPNPSISTRANAMTTAKDSLKDVNKVASTAVKREWNTDKLGLRLGSDALAAGAAGALVAPIITMIDKGIIENASGRNTLSESLKKSAKELLLKPHRFITGKPFVLIFVGPPLHTPNSRTCTVERTIVNMSCVHRVFILVHILPPTASIPSLL